MLKKLLEKMKAVLTSANTSLGFTLIELLIVIVIIGILAGVLIAVINPAQQQNRARDANVKAMMNKMALSANAYIAAYGTQPTGAQFLASLAGTTAVVSGCGATWDCIFTYQNAALPSACPAAVATSYLPIGANTSPCSYRYLANAVNTFRIYAASYGIANTIFRYDANTSSIVQCGGVAVAGDADC